MVIKGPCGNCIHEPVCKYKDEMIKLIRNLGYTIDPDYLLENFHPDIIISCNEYTIIP